MRMTRSKRKTNLRMELQLFHSRFRMRIKWNFDLKSPHFAWNVLKEAKFQNPQLQFRPTYS